jgi:hypothetical protein
VKDILDDKINNLNIFEYTEFTGDHILNKELIDLDVLIFMDLIQ